MQMAYDTHDISGRWYLNIAIDGISNISERTISRINGEYIFVGSGVPLWLIIIHRYDSENLYG